MDSSLACARPSCTSVSSSVKLLVVLPRMYRTQWGGYYFPELVRHCSIFFFFFFLIFPLFHFLEWLHVPPSKLLFIL